MATRVALLLLLGLAGCLRPARAQVFQFEDAATPLEKSLSAHYIFYVYSREDAPVPKAGDATLEFRGLYSRSLSRERTTAALAGYQGLQVSILPYYEFWKLLSPDKFCSTAEDVRKNITTAQDQILVHKEEKEVFSHTIHFGQKPQEEEGQTEVLTASGAYVLVYSNCGSFDEGTATGQVIVRNPYGFLPGIEYYKMPFYGWLLTVYGILLLVWLVSILRWWKDLFYIHSGITMILILGGIEAGLWAFVYQDWNSTGVRKKPHFFAAILSSVLKTTAAYVLVLVASLGSGVTRPDLDPKTSMKIHILALVFIVLDFGKTSVMAFQHSHAWKLSFKMMFTVPVLLVHAALFCWIFRALGNLVNQLQDMSQLEKLKPFARMQSIMITVLVGASLTSSLQMFDITGTRVAMWKFHWLISDGLPHGLFMLALLGGIWTWLPGAETARFSSDQIFVSEPPQTGKKGYRSVPSPEAIGAQDEDSAMML